MTNETPFFPSALQTARLELIPSTAALVRFEIGDREALGKALRAAIPADWPPEELRDVLPIFLNHLEKLEAHGDEDVLKWVTYYWISRTEADGPRTLVGSGGYMRIPDAEGTMEIGYGTHEAYRRKGYAREAVHALAEYARVQPGISYVIAEALLENVGSVRVLETSGFVDAGLGSEEGTRRFEYARPTSDRS